MKTARKRTAEKKVTLADVAEAAGVSAITVSRVINQPEKVSETLRQRVQLAVENLGYIPNQYASSLASAKSKVIGVVIPSLASRLFVDILRGIYRVMGSAGYKVLLVDTHSSPQEEEKLIRSLLSQAPEAMILTGGDQTNACQSVLKKARSPIVQIVTLLDEPLDMNIGCSHFDVGYEAATHLLRQGYKRIGVIAAPMDAGVQQALQGFQSALEKEGQYWKNFVVTAGEISSIALGGQLLKKLIENTQGVIDAVFCTSDDLGLGAMFQSQRMGIKIPDDMAICGFNDVDVAEHVNPSMTSIYVDFYAMGEKAAKMLVDKLSGKELSQKVIDMGFEIRKRRSTSH